MTLEEFIDKYHDRYALKKDGTLEFYCNNGFDCSICSICYYYNTNDCDAEFRGDSPEYKYIRENYPEVLI